MTKRNPYAETAEPTTEYSELSRKLLNCKTTKELYEVGRNAEFRAAVALLNATEQEELRDEFSIRVNQLKGKVKMDEVANVTLIITSTEFPFPSEQYPDSKFVVIKGKREDTGAAFELVSSAGRVYRHFAKHAVPPEQRVVFYQESAAQMAAREAKPGTSPMWLVRLLPQEAAASAVVPF